MWNRRSIADCSFFCCLSVDHIRISFTLPPPPLAFLFFFVVLPASMTQYNASVFYNIRSRYTLQQHMAFKNIAFNKNSFPPLKRMNIFQGQRSGEKIVKEKSSYKRLRIKFSTKRNVLKLFISKMNIISRCFFLMLRK